MLDFYHKKKRTKNETEINIRKWQYLIWCSCPNISIHCATSKLIVSFILMSCSTESLFISASSWGILGLSRKNSSQKVGLSLVRSSPLKKDSYICTTFSLRCLLDPEPLRFRMAIAIAVLLLPADNNNSERSL